MRIWVVPHTHWDREWYLPFQQFRLRLVRTVDEIMDVLENDPSFHQFTLDGQSSVVDDYLALNPESTQRLVQLVKSGRIHIGPWYTQPDEFLVGQESLVRNLLVGRATCLRLGPAMKVGYLPDIFGHVGQMPQILRGFGIDNFLFWRGLGTEADELGILFRWRGRDGSEVFAIRLIQGYGNAVELGVEGGKDPDVDRALGRIRQTMELHASHLEAVGLNDLLMCNGGDHEPLQKSIPEILEACQDRLPEVEFRLSSYKDYIAQVSTAKDRGPVYQGEMLGSYSAAILRGVNSTRQYLKQDNEHAERAVMEAEILASLAKMRGDDYPNEAFLLAWKEILRNHAHDSICGCSVDEVHRDMRARSAAAIQLGERLRRESLAHLAEAPMVWSYRDRPREAYSVVNVQPWTRGGVIELMVPTALRGQSLQAWADDGTELPLQILKNVEAPRAAVPVAVPGFGATEVTLKAGHGRPIQPTVIVSEQTLENEFYHLTAQDNGSLSVVYKPTGMRVDNVHFLLDEADRGDEYTYCPAEDDHVWTSLDHHARTRVGLRGPVEGSLIITLRPMLPQNLQKSRRKRTWDKLRLCSTHIEVKLLAGVDRIEFRASVDNRCRDHRLRVVFPGPMNNKVRVGGAFEVVKRDFRPPQGTPEWPELPAPTRPMQHAVGIDWLSVFTKGLTEYEAWTADGISLLAITLLRCVEWLSRGDMTTRRGEAGPSLYTPEAQCQGTYIFEYAITLQPGLSDVDFLRAADDYRFGLTAGPAKAKLDGMLKVEGEGFCLSTLKGAENGRGVILRLFNPGDTQGRAIVSGAFERAEIVRLDEEPLAEDTTNTKGIRKDIGPGQIMTWRLS